METIVKIKWDKPTDKDWLCADNVGIALTSYCPNTVFKVEEIKEVDIKDVNDINTSTEQGKMLLAALAKITTESQTDKTPCEVLSQLTELKNKMPFS